MDTNITAKTYQKLKLLVTQNGFSFCVTDTLNNHILDFKTIQLSTNASANSTDEYAISFDENPTLKAKYDQILVVHDNNLSCFVPNALFDENHLSSYLHLNAKVFETDFFAFDSLDPHEMKSVFIPFININNTCIDQFGSFEYKHSSTILVSKLVSISKNIEAKKMFVHLQNNHFEIVVVQNQKLLLYNSFEYITPEDILYYILFTAEQLQLNPENFLLELLGDIDETDANFKLIYTYVRNVSLMDMSEIQARNNRSEIENRTHFILFNS